MSIKEIKKISESPPDLPWRESTIYVAKSCANSKQATFCE